MKFRESLPFADRLSISGGSSLDKYERPDAALPLDNLPSISETPQIPTILQLEEEMVVAATRDLLNTGETLRTGETPPSIDVLRRMGYDAILLLRTELRAPLMVADTLAVAAADLHAAKADQQGDGLLVATLFNQALEVALPSITEDPRQSFEAEAYRRAVKRTTPTYSFNAAHEEAWREVVKEAGWRPYPTSVKGVGYMRLIPPDPKEPLL